MELGIKGHKTRSHEVIDLLKMLGGINRYKVIGGDDKYFYYIRKKYKDIENSYIGPDEIKGYEIFSLEDFLEKFPYKVGDKVEVLITEDCLRVDCSGGRSHIEVVEITSMRWDPTRCEIAYRLKDITGEFYKNDIKGKVDEQSECEKCGLHFGSVQCFDKDFCPHNKPKSYAVGLMDDKVNECEVNKEIVMNENKPLFKPGDVVKLKGCPDKNLYWIVMDVIKDGYIFNDGKKYLFDVQHNYEKSNREVINLKPDKIAYLSINNEKYADQIEIDLGDDYEYKFEMNKLYIVKKKPTYPKTFDECCDVLNIPNDERYIDVDVLLDYNKILSAFTKLLVCRDAYWKIAGEELGLGKSWKPDFSDDSLKYNIFSYENEIILSDTHWSNRILIFPTIEMRNTFYENFKDLIEQCKELL